MDTQFKRTVSMVSRCLGVVALLSAAYFTVQINSHGDKFKNLVSTEQALRDCNQGVEKTGQSYLSANFSAISMTADFVKKSTKCLTNKSKELSQITGVSPGVIEAMSGYIHSVKGFHNLILDSKTRNAFNMTKESFSVVRSRFSKTLKEIKDLQVTFSKQSEYLSHSGYLASIFVLFSSMIISLLTGRSLKGSAQKRRVESAARELSINSSLDNTKEVEGLIKDALKINGMSGVNELLTKYFEHGLKKQATQMKFDRVNELAQSHPQSKEVQEELDSLRDSLTDVSIKLDSLEVIKQNLEELEGKDKNFVKLQKGVEKVLKAIEDQSVSPTQVANEATIHLKEMSKQLLKRIEEQREESSKSLEASLSPLSEKVNSLYEMALTASEQSPELEKKIEELNSKLSSLSKQVDSFGKLQTSDRTKVNNKKRAVKAINTTTSIENGHDLEACIINTINEISSTGLSNGITFDVNVSSGIGLGQSKEGVNRVIRDVVRYAVTSTQAIVGPKVMTLKSRNIKGGVLLDCAVKLVNAVEDIESMRLSSKKFHIYDGYNTQKAKNISEHFSSLTDVEGNEIGTRYNFYLQVKTKEKRALPEIPNFIN